MGETGEQPFAAHDELYRASRKELSGNQCEYLLLQRIIPATLQELAKQRYLIAEQRYGEFHPITLESLADYAFDTVLSDNFVDSQPLLILLRTRTRDALYDSHPLAARALLGLALFYLRSDYRDESRGLYEEARRLIQSPGRTLSPQEREVFVSLSAHHQRGDDFRKYVEDALASRELSLSSLLSCFPKLFSQDLPPAMENSEETDLFEWSCALFQELPPGGESAQELFDVLENLTQTYPPFRKEVLLLKVRNAEDQEEDGASHAELLENKIELARLHAEEEDFDTAYSYYEEARLLFQKVAGAGERASTTSHRLGELAYCFGQLEESKKFLKSALESSLAEAEDSEQVAHLLHRLGMLSLEDEQFEEAEQYLVNALEKKRLFFGAESLEAQLTLIALGFLARKCGAYPLARGYYQEALQIEIELVGEDSQQFHSLHEELRKIDTLQEATPAEPAVGDPPREAKGGEEREVIISDVGFFRAGGKRVSSAEVEEDQRDKTSQNQEPQLRS
ncbi:tetratricopeptide repeat protein [bacterium]|nr:tetratricopeptide repeat protein [bacterium]